MGATILVADDETAIRELLSDLLEDEGYTVVTVANGLEALDAIARDKPALLITDNMMPRLTGLGLIARLQAAPALAVPTILISAATPAGTLPPTVPFLAKPFDLDRLLALVQTLTGSP